jgi:HEAT repeat protein
MAAARSLGIIGPEASGAVSALGRALRDKEGQVCFEVTLALARIGKDSVPVLIQALRDSDPEVRQAARSGLNLLGPDAEAAVPDLIKQLGARSAEDRAGAASILPRVGAPAVPPLLAALAQAHGTMRETVSGILFRCYTPPEPGSHARARLAKDDNPAARGQAFQKLATVHPFDEQIMNVFLAALNDPNDEVRLTILKTLCAMPDKPQRAVLHFSAGLRDESPQVREWSARALGSMGSLARGTLSNLTRLAAKETNVTVRTAQNEAMEKIVGTNAAGPAGRN